MLLQVTYCGHMDTPLVLTTLDCPEARHAEIDRLDHDAADYENLGATFEARRLRRIADALRGRDCPYAGVTVRH